MKSVRNARLLLVLCVFALCAAKKHVVTHDTKITGKGLGVGVIIGNTTGLVGKMQLTDTTSVDAGLAMYWGGMTMLYGDYLMHFPGVFKGQNNQFVNQLTPYVGGGVQLALGSFYYSASFGLGVRVPVGIEWRPIDPPLGVFLEVAPSVAVLPGFYTYFQGGLGARYYF